ncbi:hypothetical protein [Chroococcidiopsis sp.]|uniref:hypothetical protein n=1 Tax=Chroococcidiopsis sp. TaxID=3088168 RepID=UPI003F3B973A
MSLSLVELLVLTFHSLRSNPLRSALTALGVFMGVAAVSATLQVGSISRIVIAQRLAERDAPQIMVGLNWQAGSDLSAQMSRAELEFFRQRLAVAVADTFNLPYQFEPSTASLALASALLVGMGAGFIPALRASQLDPVKALRSE